MTVASVADLCALFDHSYCAEGAEFLSLYGITLGTSALIVGPLSMNATFTPDFNPDTWPDETATADATQANPSFRPTWHGSDSNFGGRPSMIFANAHQMKSALYGTAFTQPGEVWVVGRDYDDTVDDGGSFVNVDEWMIDRSSSTQWRLFAGSSLQTATYDTSAHLFEGQLNTASSVFVIDGSSVASGNAGSNTLQRTTIGHPSSLSTFGTKGIVFVGVKDSQLAAGDRTDGRAFVSSYWGTP